MDRVTDQISAACVLSVPSVTQQDNVGVFDNILDVVTMLPDEQRGE
jgi:hypothetical protein